MRDWLLPGRTARDIINRFMDRHDVSWNDLAGKSRRQPIAALRQDLYLALREGADMSTPRIARLIGKRDHTTIVHGIKRAKERMNANNASA